MVPNLSCIACHPATAPGTVIRCTPDLFISVIPRCANTSGGQPRRSPSAGIQSVQLPGLGFINDREQIAADAVHGRLDHSERRVGRDGRVDRIAAFFEHARARLRRQRLAGRHDAELRDHHRASLIAPGGVIRVVLRKCQTDRQPKAAIRFFIRASSQSGNKPSQLHCAPAASRGRSLGCSTSSPRSRKIEPAPDAHSGVARTSTTSPCSVVITRYPPASSTWPKP